MKEDLEKVAFDISSEIRLTQRKRMKVKTLIGRFGFQKRTIENAEIITQLFSDNGVFINPSIMKLGDYWKLTLEDNVTLFSNKQEEEIVNSNQPPLNWNSDGWFDKIITKEFRTEKEVETKFIIPLLFRLGFTEEDRFDGMTFTAFHGSKSTILETDFCLFDNDNELLGNQVLLVVEAKKENRLSKEVELISAQKQTKSYAIWLSCHYGLVTDGRKIQVLDLFPSINGLDVKFECRVDELGKKFLELYALIGKPNLVKYYEALTK
jgi:hypothetical protein